MRNARFHGTIADRWLRCFPLTSSRKAAELRSAPVLNSMRSTRRSFLAPYHGRWIALARFSKRTKVLSKRVACSRSIAATLPFPPALFPRGRELTGTRVRAAEIPRRGYAFPKLVRKEKKKTTTTTTTTRSRDRSTPWIDPRCTISVPTILECRTRGPRGKSAPLPGKRRAATISRATIVKRPTVRAYVRRARRMTGIEARKRETATEGPRETTELRREWNRAREKVARQRRSAGDRDTELPRETEK